MEPIDHDALLDIFERLDDAAEERQLICLIGAAAVLSYGSPQRQTQILDPPIKKGIILLNRELQNQGTEA